MSNLKVHDAHVRLGDKQVLAGIGAEFAPGQITCIVGPNGAGKSTLLTLLVGLRAPDRGEVLIGGVDVARVPARQRAQRIAYLPQIPEVAWPIDVRTLVGLGRTPYLGARGLTASDEAVVASAMDAAGVTAMAARNINSLSGGERARALIARALAGEPEWLLADEPLAGLDPGYQLEVAALFRRLARGGQGIIVTLHDLHTALRMADRVIVLADGRILADDVPARALSPDILAAAYGVQTRFWDGAGGPMIEIVGGRGAT